MSRRKPVDLVVGIDPGNDQGGMSFWRPTGLYRSLTMSPWYPWNVLEMEILVPENIRVYGEVPQNGTHKSRGGVHFALGMMVEFIKRKFGLTRQQLVKVTPRQWRKVLVDMPGETDKDKAEAWCQKHGHRYASVDEAEAICIGYYGALEVWGSVPAENV